MGSFGQLSFITEVFVTFLEFDKVRFEAIFVTTLDKGYNLVFFKLGHWVAFVSEPKCDLVLTSPNIVGVNLRENVQTDVICPYIITVAAIVTTHDKDLLCVKLGYKAVPSRAENAHLIRLSIVNCFPLSLHL